MISLGAEILTPERMNALRPSLGRVVATGIPGDPIHPGHISCLIESKKYGDTLVAIVNGDGFLRKKKGKPFQDLRTRAAIVSAIRGVDYVFPYETEDEMGVQGALEIVKPNVYTKGGDRTGAENIRDWDFCQKNGIEVVTGVGLDKQWSSSKFLDDWVAFANAQKGILAPPLAKAELSTGK